MTIKHRDQQPKQKSLPHLARAQKVFERGGIVRIDAPQIVQLPRRRGRYLDHHVRPFFRPRPNPERRLATEDVEAKALNKAFAQFDSMSVVLNQR
jgi:hypothetical protein